MSLLQAIKLGFFAVDNVKAEYLNSKDANAGMKYKFIS
jgi:hypothetical protein